MPYAKAHCPHQLRAKTEGKNQGVRNKEAYRHWHRCGRNKKGARTGAPLEEDGNSRKLIESNDPALQSNTRHKFTGVAFIFGLTAHFVFLVVADNINHRISAFPYSPLLQG